MEILTSFDILQRIRSITADGCFVNTAAFVLLERVLIKSIGLICISHSANNVGKRFKMCRLLENAIKFEEKWSYMMNVSSRARELFKVASGKCALRPSEVRWYNFFEVIKQIYENSLAVKNVIESIEDFAEESRMTLKELICDEVVHDLRIELAIIVSVGKHLTILCYDNEKDGKIQCAKSFDQWNKTFEYLNECVSTTTTKERRAELLPEVHDNIRALSNNNVEYNGLMENAINVIRVLAAYMRSYSDNNLERTLRVLRACRFFNFFLLQTLIRCLWKMKWSIYKILPIFVILTLKMD
jgi:acetone carboxylase gamma subunit